MLEAIYNKWKSKTITGEQPAVQQPIVAFKNSGMGLELLHKHLDRKSRVAIHCDVDMDGIGSGYIMRRFAQNFLNLDPILLINKGKKHGVHAKHIEFFNKYPIDLLIILDSSSNELNIIKELNCDVLVIDHHEVDHTEYYGKTSKGTDYVIVNNTLDNLDISKDKEWIIRNNPNTSINLEGYNATSDMSCGVTLYELLRLYQETYNTGNLLENLYLYQWAGITLFTDAIQLANERNQWFVENTVHSRYVEPTLAILIKNLNRFTVIPDKSFINYTLAPTFNKAIRANANLDALNIVMFSPDKVAELSKYKELQDIAIAEGMKLVCESDTYCKVDISNTEISINYSGVISGKVVDEYKKNTITYRVDSNNRAKGSFRGRSMTTDYRTFFTNYSDSTIAQGHKGAFGFEANVEDLDNIMSGLAQIEENESFGKLYLTAGNLRPEEHGEYHIDDIEQFKRQGGLMMLAIGNSKVSSNEQIMISVSSKEATLVEKRGQLFIYNILGLECKAFKEIEEGIINIYAEFSKTIEFYVK